MSPAPPALRAGCQPRRATQSAYACLRQPPIACHARMPTTPAPSSAQAAATGRLCVTNAPASPPSTAPIATSGQTIMPETAAGS